MRPTLTWQESHRRRNARRVYRNGIRSGKVVKPEACQRCGAKVPKGRLHGHHPDYSEPYVVVWLCRGCHDAEHAEARA